MGDWAGGWYPREMPSILEKLVPWSPLYPASWKREVSLRKRAAKMRCSHRHANCEGTNSISIIYVTC